MRVWVLRCKHLGYVSWIDEEKQQVGFSHDLNSACVWESDESAMMGVVRLRKLGLSIYLTINVLAAELDVQEGGFFNA